MFFVIKILKPFIMPPALIALGLLISIVLLYRKKERLAKILLIAVLALYYLFSVEPTAFLLARSLERQYPAHADISLKDSEKVRAIVIMAGGIYQKGQNRPFAELSGASWKRLWHGIEIYRQLDSKIPILYSGGSGDPFDPVSTEAEVARDYAVSAGIPKGQFWVEAKSRNTLESGEAVRNILKERFSDDDEYVIVLVTSAIHMPRSVSVMQRQGIKAIPAPADFGTKAVLRLSPLSFIPQAGYFESSSASIHEWVGRAGYWVIAQFDRDVV